jgi:hypothetical protein
VSLVSCSGPSKNPPTAAHHSFYNQINFSQAKKLAMAGRGSFTGIGGRN